MSGKTNCADITTAELAGVTDLTFSGASPFSSLRGSNLKSGDFAGLTGLTHLNLDFNEITTLPADIFSGLSALTILELNNNQLSTLPTGVFSGLTALTGLDLSSNSLPASLPASLFTDVPRNAITLPTGTTINAAAPTTVGTIANITDLVVNGSPQTVDVANKFSDTDDTLTYTVESNNTATATVAVSGSAITITPVAIGTADITVTATDTAGQTATQTFVVTVVDTTPVAVPSISISSATVTATVGTAIANITIDSSGGAVDSYSISPTLTAGLTLDTDTGAISGTPTAVAEAIPYTIKATNSGGEATATVAITVNDVAPSITISTDAVTATVGTAIADITIDSSGGAVASYGIAPTLPEGLSIDTSTGTISGTPTAVAEAIPYTIKATNSGGEATATVAITVNDVAPSITISTATVTVIAGTAITPITIDSTSGGTVASYDIDPAIENGLTFDATTGTISGAPDAVAGSKTYTITATNRGGEDDATVAITVNAAPITVPTAKKIETVTVGSREIQVEVATKGSKTITGFVAKEVPSQELQKIANRAVAEDGIDLSNAPSSIDRTIPPTLVAGTAVDISVDKNECPARGCEVTLSYEAGDVPAGKDPYVFHYDAAASKWEALPHVSRDTNARKVTALATSFSPFAVFSASSNKDAAPMISITPATVTATAGTAIEDITIASTGGTVGSYSIDPAIGNGLSFDENSGTISGTPTAVAEAITYTITATNSAGMDTAMVAITVTAGDNNNPNDAPTITGTPDTTVAEDTAYSFTPTGADADAGTTLVYTIENKPSWAAFSTTTGALTGTLTAALPAFSTAGTNDAPTANAGDDETVTEGAMVTLDGSASSDPEMQTLTYAWTQTAGVDVTLSDATAAMPTFTAATQLLADAVLTFSLVVSDGNMDSTADTVTITVNAGMNDAPTANAGPDQIVDEGAMVTLDGRASADPEREAITYAWTQTSGMSVTLAGRGGNERMDTRRPRFKAPVELVVAAELVFSLVVTDARGKASPADLVTITVTAGENDAPTANAGPDQIVDGGVGVGVGVNAVFLSGTASSDPEGESLSYAWLQISGTPVNLLRPSNSIPSFFVPQVGSAFIFSLVVTDARGKASEPVTVTVKIRPVFTEKVTDKTYYTNGIVTNLNLPNALGVGNIYTLQGSPSLPRGLQFEASTRTLLGVPIEPGVFDLTYTVTDQGNRTDTLTFRITVIDATIPIADAGPDRIVDAGIWVLLEGNGEAVGAHAPVDSYMWTQTRGTPVVELFFIQRPILRFLTPHTAGGTRLEFSLIVTDTLGVRSTADTVTITVNAGMNDAPTADAGNAQTVAEGAMVTLDGTGSSDPEGEDLTYAWTQTAGTTVTLSNAAIASPTFTAPNQLLADAELTFSLVVNDGTTASTADTVTITVTGVNAAPTADAGTAQTVAEGATVTLDGSASSDPEMQTLTYAWTQTAGVDVTLSDATAAMPTFTAATQLLADAVLTFSLVVNDGNMDSTADTVTITVMAGTNDAPTADAGDDETVTEGATVALDGTGSTDSEGETLTYAWTHSNMGITLSDNTDAMPTFTAPNQLLADAELTFSLVVNDGNTDSTADTVTITVMAGTNDAPIANAGDDQTNVTEGATVTLDGSASSDPEMQTLTYAWTQTAGTTVSLDNANMVSPTFTAATQLLADAVLTFSLVVNDGNMDSTADTVTITVTNVNDAPTITGTPATTVAEDTAYSFTPTGADADAGATLVYSIENKPSWADFSTTTGALTGTPTNGDVGSTTSGIVITLTSGSDTASLPAFNLTVNAAPIAAPMISISAATVTAIAGTAIADITITSTGGTVASYSIMPAITNGLSFDASTGTISGTPDAAANEISYTITATNSAGTDTAMVVITVEAPADTTAPIITLNGDNPQTIESGADYTELGATTDDGSDVSIDSSAYRNVVGTYIITYTATDGTNPATPVTRTVNVVDTTAPIITLTGDDPQIIEQGAGYTELGATTDDGSEVSVDSSAYRNVVGTYIITYTATDGTNQATATRTVNVVDTTAPIITLTGANPQTIELGVDYTELGATTDDGSDVSIDSSAYRNVVGIYIITYTATDGTNQATATRTVNVVDTTAPIITLTGANPQTIELGVDYTELGATTDDGSVVSVDSSAYRNVVGTYIITYTATDGTNQATATRTVNVVDTTAPVAPVITPPTTLTNENTITITGTTVEGSTVTLTQNDNVLTSTVTIDSDGTWSVDVTLIQGANTFTATATDQAGNISDVSNSVTVTLDNTAPVAPVITPPTTLTNENTITITGTTVEGSTVTLTQNDNVLTSTVTIDSDGTWSVDVTLIQGANTFTATATDQADNISDVSNSVTVTLDNAAPIITLTGANPQTIELGVDYTELGATTDDGSDVSVDSSAYRNVVGTYIITYTATDGTNQATVTRTVNVVDTTAPIITLTGANPQTIESGADYTELGATTDDGSDVSIDSSAYRNVVGTYIITYTATDGTNQATATRTVNVVDTTAPVAPVITPPTTLTNENTITITGTTVEGSTVTLTQNDNVLTSTVTIDSDGTWSVDVTLIQGANTFTATATDQAGNISDVSNSVTVTLDNTAPVAPVITPPTTLTNENTITITGTTVEDSTVTLTQNDIALTPTIITSSDGTWSVDVTLIQGANTFTATATDQAGNISDVSNSVTVTLDNTAPVAPVITPPTTLTNENTITITGTTVEGSTVTLTQNDNVLTSTVTIDSDGTWSVDVTLIQGANTFTATATDQADNISDVSNSVTVTLDNAAPIITLTGANPQTIESGADYTELGATTDDGSDVSVDSSAYRNVVGTYIITYTATDGTNQATVTRTVNVVDTTAPIITLTGANPQTIESGADYTELGATTDDGSDVSIDSSAYRNVVGTYIITYTATDGTNQATATRTVNVVDTTAPIITLTGDNPQTIESGADYTELGATTDDGSEVSIDSSAFMDVVGTYTITYTATDGTNPATPVTRTVNVVDTTAPIITLTGANPQTIESGADYTELGATTDDGSDVSVDSSAYRNVVGTYIITYTATDGTNQATVTRTVNVVDTTAPIITLTGANPQTIESGADYTELGATTDDGSDVSIDSSAYRNVVGTYIITYTATDGTNQATATRTVNVVDTTAPIITLTGDNPQTIESGADYTELGATTDDGSTVTIDSSAYRNVVGTYIITYTATDGTNQATATRTVNVVDTTAPIITLTGANPQTIESGADYTELGATTDDGSDVSIDSSAYRNVVGTYIITYTATDGTNQATATRTVNVVDTTAPIITLTGANPQTIELGVDYTELGATTDDGSTVTIDSSAFTDVVGTYIITYTATDGTNQATATRTVNVVDTTAPIITLTGANPQTIELGVDYTELGATTDDGSTVTIDSSAYRNVVGTYIITYTATDGTNQATATRTVNVVDTTAPIITLTGANPQTIELGAGYTELGATADDNSTVTIDDDAFMDVVGAYTITYTATDGTNQATATRTVNVVDTTAPIITLTGANPQTIESGADYTELGATTDDGSDVSIDSSAYRNVVGTYIITYTATDGTNQATATRTVNVVDTTAPVAPVITPPTTLTNENTITITGTTVEGSTVTLTQNDNVLTSTVTIDSDGTWSVDVTLIQGANTFTATATDQADNISDVSNSVTVTLDNTAPVAPVITPPTTLTNENTITITGTTVEGSTVTLTQNDIALTPTIITSSDGTWSVDVTLIKGANTFTATATDQAGNISDVSNSVTVTLDNTAPVAPVITPPTTLTNENTITITGTTVEGSTVTLTQNDNVLTSTVTIDSDGTWSVDVTLIQGANTFTATATDQADNISDVSNSVTVTLDNAAPIITLTGANPQTIESGADYTELGATTDDGSDVSVDSSAYRNVVGTYIITYTATDGTNQATVTRTVNVVDTTAPVAPVITSPTTLTNENTITITGTTVEGSTVTLTQNDNVLTSTVTIDSDGIWSVDVTLIQGANTFTATATDQAGNISDVSNSVTVTLDNAAPIITLTGANPQTIESGADYTELGATTDDGSEVSVDSSAYRNVVGTYIITYTATDGTNQATATRTVNVVDTTAPIITLTGANPQTIELGVDYTELGATTDDGSVVSVDSSAYRNVVGTYIITYTATDGTNQATATRTVNVVDTTAPIITLTGANPELGVDYTELGATTDDGSVVSVDSSAYRNVVGTYIITYTATDGTNQATATRTVNVVDTTAPIITLTGDNPQTIESGADYTELGATTDDGSDVSIDSSAYRNVVGIYIITYTATDGTNQATATRTVNVVDTTAPTITLTGANPQTIELGVDYTELGATTDDGSTVTIDSSAFTDVVGTYIITYTATDGTNQATATRTVNVVDTTAPIITLTGDNPQTIESGADYTELGATTDDGSEVSIDDDAFMDVVGTYIITYTATDGTNQATATRTVNVVDTTAPIITLTGANPQTIELGVDYTELGATTDDGSVVSVDSSAYRNVVGTYIITYTATDGTNQATATRTVNVVDTTAPIITLTGDNPQTIESGADYTELGATTDDGSDVSIDSSAYRNVVGIYIITYTATDGTNQATATRTVNVVDTTAPTITLTGANPQTIELGVDYTELGATTDDGSTVTIDSSAFTDVVGTYIITYTATDGTNQVTATRTVNVVDTTAPIITLNGANPQTIELGAGYTELGATTDDGSEVTIDSSAYRNVVGTYIITYTATDGTNQATATRTVNVVDTTAPVAPVITPPTTLTNENTITITGTTVEGSTVTLTQNDNVLTSTVTIDSDGIWSVDVTLIQGANTFTATATDQAGNISDVSNSVTVTLDNAAPIITLTGANPQTIESGADYTELGATTDDGSEVSIDSSEYRNVVGTYIITYTATDGTNQATATRTVNVVDTTAPIITLTGANPQTIESGADYTELGATTDDGSVVSVDSSAYRNVVGTYIITYTATDGTNQATATRTVNVVDTTAPIITLTGANPQTIESGADYTELGATTDDGSVVSVDSSAYRNVVGTYIITYTATDGTNQATATRTVNVVDTTAPIITLTGANPQTIESGADYTELGATTDDGSEVSVDSSAYRNVVGTYIITYTATDGTNQATATRTVNVVDTTAPIITLTGANPQTIESGADYTELGATTDDGSDVSVDSSEYRNVVGTYIITYTATDGTNQATATRTVNVVDTTAPIITLTGDDPQIIEQGAGYTELGASADDGSTVTIDSSAFTDVVGTYIITYTATDGTNPATPVTRAVNVVDTTAPIITLTGDDPQIIEQGAGYTELGASADDGSTVTIDDDAFMDVVGTYTITYTATDGTNPATPVTRTVNVVDTTAPIITLTGDDPQIIEQGVGYTELGASADDGSTVTIDSSAFMDVVGTYTITYTATDGTNPATPVTRTVNVVDTTAPTVAISTTAQTVNTAAFTLAGTVDAGATVDVLKDGTSIGAASVTGTRWSLAVTLDDGANTFTATATDATDNTSDATDVVIITLDTAPTFGSAAITAIANKSYTYTAGTAIPVLTLPKATGGNGALTYSLSPILPQGLTFDTTRRTISGTPEAETASTSYTYIAADSDTNTAATDTASLTFSITVLADGLSEEDIQRLNLAIMPRLTQALVASAAASVERRVDSAFASAETTASYQLDGYQIQFDSETTTTEKLTADLLQKLAGYTRSHKDGNINWKQLLTNSSFLIPLHSANQTGADQASAANTGLALWGSGDYTRLSENDSDLDWQGDLSSYQLGLDKRLDNLLLGGMLSWSEGDVDYTLEGDEGSYNHKMTSIHPYLAWNNARTNLWGSLGYGQGDLTIKQEDNSHSTDTNLLSLAAGIKGQLISGLSLKSDLLLARTDINAAADMNIAKQTIDSQRFRLLLEIAGQYTLASGGSIKPMLEIGARYDGDSGDSGNSGTGAVLGAGMRYANLTGLTLEGNLHALVGQGNYKEWGIQALISLDPGTDKLGLAFSLRPGYGYNGSSSDTSALWQQSLPQSNLHNSAVDYSAPDYDARLGARLSYGLLAPSLVGLLTPYSEITLGTINSYRLGIRWQGTARFDLHLFGERRESSGNLEGSRGADQAIQLEGRIHF